MIAHIVALRAEEVVAAAPKSRSLPAAAEPEVVKKGKKEEEAAAEERKGQEEVSRPCFWLPVWGTRARSMRSRRIISGSSRCDRLAEQHGIRVTRKDSKALVGVGEIDGQRGDAGQAANVYESQRHVARAADGKARDSGGPKLVVVYDELDLPWLAAEDQAEGFGGRSQRHEVGDPQSEDQRFCAGAIGDSSGPPDASGADFVLAPIKRSQRKELEELRRLCGRRGSSP